MQTVKVEDWASIKGGLHNLGGQTLPDQDGVSNLAFCFGSQLYDSVMSVNSRMEKFVHTISMADFTAFIKGRRGTCNTLQLSEKKRSKDLSVANASYNEINSQRLQLVKYVIYMHSFLSYAWTEHYIILQSTFSFKPCYYSSLCHPASWNMQATYCTGLPARMEPRCGPSRGESCLKNMLLDVKQNSCFLLSQTKGLIKSLCRN